MATRRTPYELVEALIAGDMSPAVRKTVHDTLERAPIEALEATVDARVRIVKIAEHERYRDASPALRRLGIDVDAWPSPPAGLCVGEERTIYLRHASPMSIAHEFGHGLDLALGNGLYLSGMDHHIRRSFAEARSFVSPYASTGLDEYFAEAVRSLLSGNDANSRWPVVSPERLRRVAPELTAFFEERFPSLRDRERGRLEPRATRLPPELGLSAGPQPEKERPPSGNEKRNDYYRQLTADLIAVLESGNAKNVSDRMWAASASGMPFNPTTDMRYRGVNVLRLTVSSMLHGWNDPRFVTVKQANKRGWSVRKGERGTAIEVWKFPPPRYYDRDNREVTGDELTSTLADPQRAKTLREYRPAICRFYTVFNAAQIDVVEKTLDEKIIRTPLTEKVPLRPTERTWDLHERCEQISKALGVSVNHDATEYPYYLPSGPRADTIHMRPRELYRTADGYYDDLNHEGIHATGHESRLGRPTLSQYFTDNRQRAREELRAELGSFFLAAEVGLPHNMERHAEYIGSWATLLRDNHMEIFDAARDAQAAVDYLLEREREYALQRENEVSRAPEQALEAAVSPLLSGADGAPSRRDLFVQKLRELGPENPNLKFICWNEVRSLNADFAISTVRRMMSDYRALVRSELGAEHPALKYLRAFRADERDIHETTRANIAGRLQHLQAIDPELVADVAQQLLSSSDFAELAAGAVLATGRRLPEIAHGDFTAISDTYMDFRGAVAGQRKDVTFPCLAEPQIIVSAIAKLRELKPVVAMDVKELNGSYSKTITSRLRRALGPEFASISLEDARALYATIAFEWFASPAMSIVQHRAEVLGHNADYATSFFSKCRYYTVGTEVETCEQLERARLELVARTAARMDDPNLSDVARSNLSEQLAELRSMTFALPKADAQHGLATPGVSPLIGPGDSERDEPIVDTLRTEVQPQVRLIGDRLEAIIRALERADAPALTAALRYEALQAAARDSAPPLEVGRDALDALVSYAKDTTLQDRAAYAHALATAATGESRETLDRPVQQIVASPTLSPLPGEALTQSYELAQQRPDALAPGMPSRSGNNSDVSRTGAGAVRRSASSPAQSLHSEVAIMREGLIVGYPGKHELKQTRDGELLKLGIKQTFGRGNERTEKWFDVIARGEVATQLDEALKGIKQGQMLKLDVELNRGSYKDQQQRWHDKVELPIKTYEIIDKMEKGQRINRFELAGTVLDKPVLENGNGTPYVNVRLEVPGLKNDKADHLRVKAFGELAQRFAAEVEQGQTVPIAGKLQLDAFNDRNGAKQVRPEIIMESWGSQLQQQQAPTQKAIATEQARAQGPQTGPFADQPHRLVETADKTMLVEFSRSSAEPVSSREVTVVQREALPYTLTGKIVGESLDGQSIYMELGRDDVLRMEKSSFDGGRVPSVGDRVEVQRDTAGHEKATFKDEQRQQAQAREQERDGQLERV